MSVMDKLINAMKINVEPYDEDEYYDEDDLDDEAVEEVVAEEKAPAPARPRQSRPAKNEPAPRQNRPAGQTSQARASRSVKEERTMPRDRDNGYDDYENTAPARRPAGSPAQRRSPQAAQRAPQTREGQTARSVKRSMTEAGMEVCVIKPTSVNDAREVTDNLLVGSTVVLNLEGLDVDIAQRIIDFTSGSTYAMRGNVMKISHYIFVITPANVDISGDVAATTNSGAPANLTSPFSKK